MIKIWTSHECYLEFLKTQVVSLSGNKLMRFRSFAQTLAKLTALNLDPLFDVLKQYYSSIGRPAIHQPEIFRSLILMMDQGETSVDCWVNKLSSDPLLAIFIGCSPDDLPPLGSYYDLIDRLWLRHEKLEKADRKRLYTFNRKPTAKIGKNKKLPNKNSGVVGKIARFFLKGRSFDKRPEKLL